MRLRLDEAAHDPERPEQAPVAEEHARNGGVVWAAARYDRSRDREGGAAVLEDDAGSGRDDPGSEALVQALDEGHGHAVAVDRAEVDGAARGLGDRCRPRTRIQIRPCDQLAQVRAVPNAPKRVLESEPHRPDLVAEA